MRKSQDWQDYRLIDASDGQRLEKWGGITLVRPDPQIIWKNPDPSPLWSKADAVYHRSSSGGGNWEYRKQLPESWNISYKGLTFMVKPTGFKHTGIFPEQAVNWDLCSELIKNAGREIRRGNRYDGIILDPPSYGRGTNGEMWKLEDSICDLMNMCTEVLSDNPLFIVLNSYTTGLSSSVMTYLLQMTVGRKYKIRVDSQEIGLPVEQTGLAVPAGNTAVVYFD